VCIEDNLIVSVLTYEPNCPSGVECVAITDSDYAKINEKTHYFDVASKTVVELASSQQETIKLADQSAESIRFLNSTDWQVLRHIRQLALGVPTTLSQDEYIALEQQRQRAADNVVR
jgi:hypothetical protein